MLSCNVVVLLVQESMRLKQKLITNTILKHILCRFFQRREVPARPWVRVCVPLALSLHYFQCNRNKFNLFNI